MLSHLSTNGYLELASSSADFFSVEQPGPLRIFHGRSHLYPGLEHLSVDWLSPIVLITTYAEINNPYQLAKMLLEVDELKQIKCIILQYRKRKGTPSVCLHGHKSENTIVVEHGLKYEVQPGVNQNAGLFLDIAPLRRWLRDHSKNRNVLNLFSYTCSLSVAALAGNAKQVINVDMSKTSIEWGIRNHKLNDQDTQKIRSIPHNLFRSWGKMKQFGRYDTIIIDPPTRQRGSFNAEKNYGAVLKKLGGLMKDRADVIATVNSPYLNEDFLPNLAQRYSPRLRLNGLLPIAPAFADKFPEKALKIYHFTNQ